MAFIEKLQFDNGSEEIFNVSQAVGAWAANFWTDIMLVQYFISYIYTYNGTGIGNAWRIKPLTMAERRDLPNPHKDFKNNC